jgi:hypothetical protein
MAVKFVCFSTYTQLTGKNVKPCYIQKRNKNDLLTAPSLLTPGVPMYSSLLLCTLIENRRTVLLFSCWTY